MSDHLKLLDGPIGDVVTALDGLSDAAAITALLAAERAGKNRKGVITHLEAAVAKLSENSSDAGATAGGEGLPGEFDAGAVDGLSAADIPPASEFHPSGAPDQVVPGIVTSHPALDADPRAHTTNVQNRIDLNDPHLSGSDTVERQLSGDR